MMTKNLGSVDRYVRFVIGVVLLVLVFTGPKTNWGWLGLIPLLTSLAGSCPVYSVFGISTRKTARA